MSVSIVRSGTNIKKAISDALSLIDFKLTKKNIFIKPNLVIPARPNSGIITDPAVVVSLAEVLREEYGAGEIIVGDGPQIGCSIKECFEIGGYKKAAREHDLKLIDLYKVKRVSVSWKYGLVDIPEIIQECCYINVPKIKTHSQTTVTLSLKNQKGLLSAFDKKNFHKLDLHEPIAELYRVAKPDLVVVDGLIGIEGDGPTFGGKRRRLDLIIAGIDALEVDEVCCGIMGVSPDEVKHLKIAAGFSEKSARPKIRGIQIDELKTRPFKRANEKLRKIGKIRYWRNPSTCTMCSESIAQAINEIKGSPLLVTKHGPHLLYHILLKRLDFLTGKDAEIPQNHGEIFCIGNCVAPLAIKYNSKLAPGCPPKPREILNKL
jgi:uncharacterized protein (DUF362 family)